MRLILILALSMGAIASGQQARFDDVVRNLRNPDPDARLEALKMLRESQHLEARKRLAFIIETRSAGGRAQAAFDAGPLAAWPRPVPDALITSLLKAVDD